MIANQTSMPQMEAKAHKSWEQPSLFPPQARCQKNPSRTQTRMTKLFSSLLLLVLLIQNTYALTSSGIVSEPRTVQTKRAAIKFWATPDITIRSGGTVSLTAPNSVVIYSQDLRCSDMIRPQVSCAVELVGRTFVVTTFVDLPAQMQFQFEIGGAINNPDSEQPTTPWSLLTSTGESEIEDVILEAVAGRMTKFTLEPDSQVVGEATTLRVTMQTQSQIPQDSFVFLTFPKWNPEKPEFDQQKTYIQGSEVCRPYKVLHVDMSCDFQNDQLIVSQGFPSQMPANIEISFSVSGFKNPISTKRVSGFRIYTAVKSGQNYYKVDEEITSLQVTQYAPLSQARLDVRYPEAPNAGIVQELNEMQLSFYLPVPLNQGCKLTIQLPSQYDVNFVQTVSPSKVFGEYIKLSRDDGDVVIDTPSNSFHIFPCRSYIPNIQEATIFIDSLKQFKYEKTTDSLKVFIDSRDGFKISSIENSVTFTPRRGQLVAHADATNKVVQASTFLKFQLKPNHIIYAQDQPELQIEFPPEIAISSVQISNIFMQNSTQSVAALGPSFSHFQKIITIKNFLPADYIPDTGNIIYVTIGEIVNPISTYQVDGMKLTFFAQGKYAIDEYEGPITWELETGGFNFAAVDPGSFIAYFEDNDYTFRFSPQHAIPKNGYVEIHIPAQVTIPDLSYTQSSCVAVQGTGFSTTQINCEFVIPEGADETQAVTSDSQGINMYYILRILNAFRRTEGPADMEYVLRLPGLRNPIQTLPTNSFKFITFTREGHAIDRKDSGVVIQMIQSAELATVQLVLDNYTNAYRAKYTFTLVPSVPVKQNNLLMFTFPKQIKLPDLTRQLSCYSSFINLIANVECQFSQQFERTVIVDLTFALGVSQINALDRFSIQMNNIINPESTRTTDSIEVKIVDTNFVSVNSKTQGITVTTNQPYVVRRATLGSSTPQPGIEATFNLTFVPEHDIDPQGGILIIYPPQTTPSETRDISVNVQVDGLYVQQDALSVSYDLSARAILIANVIQGRDKFRADYRSQSSIRILLDGLRNPFTNAETDSFQMTTFNFVSGRFYYYIDTVEKGLTFNAECDYPCKTCPSDNPELCTSCYEDLNIKNGLPYLQLGTCVAECATSRFYNQLTQHCDECAYQCLECEVQANRCTACGVDDFLYLHKNECRKDCPPGYLKDSSTNQCIQCAANCLTCENTINTCTSCDSDGVYPYFFRDNCISECTADISVLVGNQCVECDSTCKTCSSKPDQCTSCESHMRYDPKKNTCTQMCEFETQIFIPQTLTCEYCGENCSTCAGTVETCTSCQPGYVLNTDLTCKAQCGFTNQTAVEGVCKECESPCATCDGLSNYCTSCLNDYLLFQGSKCVQYCPDKYAANEEGTACYYEGLICPDGFSVNLAGDGCVPIEFDCEIGYQINEKRTACVPAPGSPIPFPFLLAAVFLGFLVLGSYLKDKFFTKVMTNLIALIGCFEIFMYALMIGHSIANEWYVITFFCIIGFLGLMVANAAFLFYYRKEIVGKDIVYAKWLNFFPKTKALVPFLILLVNFKTVKMLYGGFYGLENAMAKFGDCQTFYRIMRLVTYFSFVFSYGFIFIADIIIFFVVDWGYQLLILGIETLILQLLIIVLTFFEFRIPPKQLLNANGEAYSIIKPKDASQLRVMGGLDDDDYEEGIPDMDEQTLIRSRYAAEEKEIGLRKNALVKILNAYGGNLGAENQQRKAEIGGDLDACMTKFDEKQLRFRRAFSMSDLGDDESWVAEGNSNRDPDGDPYGDEMQEYGMDEYGNEFPIDREKLLQRRYSYPLLKDELATVPNPAFAKQIGEIQEAAQDYLIDNVYAETKKVEPNKTQKKRKTVSRRTQTYLRELLQLEGEDVQESDMEVLMEDEAEIDEDYAQKLINNVIDGLSEDESTLPAGRRRVKKPKKKHVFRPRKNIPDFELTDIMGEFEIDDLGNFIIMRGPRGELLDRKDRKVNRRGYLVDRFGNVINTQGNVIFKAVELDVDDEIPAPFGFEKRKKNLMKMKEDYNEQFKVDTSNQEITEQYIAASTQSQKQQLASAMDTEEMLEKELQEIRNQNKNYYGMATAEKEDFAASAGYSIDEIANIDAQNVDQLIDKVTQKKVPRKKEKLRKQHDNKKGSGFDNMPPRRIRQEDTRTLFPMINVDSTEQKRLNKIASSISGMAHQMSEQQKNMRIHEAFTNQQNSTLKQLNSQQQEMMEAQRLDKIKQEHLKDIIADADFSALNTTDMANQQNSLMMQQRPTSQSNLSMGRFNSTMGAKPNSTSNRQAAYSSEGRSRKHFNRAASNHKMDQSNLQKVYGNIVDLVGFEEQALQEMIQPRKHSPTGSGGKVPKRGISGHSGERRLKGLEAVYLNKMNKKASGNIPPPQMKNFTHGNKSDVNPFRPTLDRFNDDPAQLNVHTMMDGQNFGGKDMSLVIAERLDNLQQNYLTNSVNMTNQMAAQHQRTMNTKNQHVSAQDLNFNPQNRGMGSTSVRVGQTNLGQNLNYNTNAAMSALGHSRSGVGQYGAAQNSGEDEIIEPVKQGNWTNSGQ